MALLKQLYKDFPHREYSGRLFKRTLTAQWKPVDIKNNNSLALQALTDAMTYNATIQINYRNSGWRTIIPYGWNASKDGNILLMCYKNTGEIRSYRIDRIYDLLVNDTLMDKISENNPYTMNFEDFKIPMLPNIDEIIEETENEVNEELPYDVGLKALTDNQVPDDITKPDQFIDGEDIDEIENEEDNNSDLSDDFNINDIDFDDIDFNNEENEEDTDNIEDEEDIKDIEEESDDNDEDEDTEEEK